MDSSEKHYWQKMKRVEKDMDAQVEKQSAEGYRKEGELLDQMKEDFTGPVRRHVLGKKSFVIPKLF